MTEGEHVNIGIASNTLTALHGCEILRDLPTKFIDVSFFAFNNGEIIKDVGFKKSEYCRDIFRNEYVDFKNQALEKRISKIFDGFQPQFTITTSKNRYLEAACKEKGIPLICTEMGPLPRTGFPNCRQVSVGHHASSKLPLQIFDQISTDIAAPIVSTALEQQSAAIANAPKLDEVRAFVASVKERGSVAVLALQPDDWVTWEGALGAAMSPAEIILAALDRMESDFLLILFHPDPRGFVPSNIMTDIWLTNPRMVRVPNELEVGQTELFLPFVDELITVSSNLGFLAFLLEKDLKVLGSSFLSDLESSQTSSSDTRHSISANIIKNLHVDSEVFEDRERLRSLIFERLQHEGWASSVGEKTPEASHITNDWVTSRTLDDELEDIHKMIQSPSPRGSDEGFGIKNFGRNYLGYLVKNNAIGAELGVAGGYFSESLLRSQRFKRLYSVDAWADHHDEAEFLSVQKRLEQFGRHSTILRNTFDEALRIIPDRSLDFIYIDGYAHTGMNAELLEQWLRKMRPGALVSGHDYSEEFWPLNWQGINKVLKENTFEVIRDIPGVLTRNLEDALPSFLAIYKPEKSDNTLGRLWKKVWH